MPKASEAEIDHFLDRLYAAAVEPDGWDRVMHAIMDLFRTDMAHVGMHESVSGQSTKANYYGYDTHVLGRGAPHYQPMDPWARLIGEDLSSGRRRPSDPITFHGGSLLPFERLRETEYHHDFARILGCDDCLVIGGSLNATQSYGAVVNTGDGRLFDDGDVATSRLISGHVLRAMRLHQKVAQESGLTRLGQFWTDSSVAMLLTSGGKVDYENPAATALLSAKGPVTSHHGRLQFRDTEVQAAFEMLLRPRPVTEPGRPHALAFHMHDDAEARWLVQFICLRPNEGSLWSMVGPSAPTVLVAITPLTALAAARQDAISGFVQLTESEREVLRLLVQGLSAEAIARASGRSVATVRWHIRSLIGKLQATSVADVVRIGALVLPV